MKNFGGCKIFRPRLTKYCRGCVPSGVDAPGGYCSELIAIYTPLSGIIHIIINLFESVDPERTISTCVSVYHTVIRFLFMVKKSRVGRPVS